MNLTLLRLWLAVTVMTAIFLTTGKVFAQPISPDTLRGKYSPPQNLFLNAVSIGLTSVQFDLNPVRKLQYHYNQSAQAVFKSANGFGVAWHPVRSLYDSNVSLRRDFFKTPPNATNNNYDSLTAFGATVHTGATRSDGGSVGSNVAVSGLQEVFLVFTTNAATNGQWAYRYAHIRRTLNGTTIRARLATNLSLPIVSSNVPAPVIDTNAARTAFESFMPPAGNRYDGVFIDSVRVPFKAYKRDVNNPNATPVQINVGFMETNDSTSNFDGVWNPNNRRYGVEIINNVGGGEPLYLFNSEYSTGQNRTLYTNTTRAQNLATRQDLFDIQYIVWGASIDGLSAQNNDTLTITPLYSPAGAPVKLGISLDFSNQFYYQPTEVTVEARNESGLMRNVVQPTGVALSLGTNLTNGTLGGTVSGTIPAGQPRVTLPVVFSAPVTADSLRVSVVATRTSGDGLATGESPSFPVNPSPSAFLDANLLKGYFTNRIDNLNDPATTNAGLEFPKGSGLKACFKHTVWVAAKYNSDANDIRTTVNPNVAGSRQEFQPGYITSTGDASAFFGAASSMYKIKTGDNAATSGSYANWPVSLGAPATPSGQPLLIGNQAIWSVANDLKTPRYYSAQPLGCELQQYSYAFDKSAPQTVLDTALNQTIFLSYRLINKSAALWKDAYIGIWADTDIGSGVDLTGCDTLLGLGYTYNGNGNDVGGYGTTPPATGFTYLEGRRNRTQSVPLLAFVRLNNSGISPEESGPEQSQPGQVYNFLRGLNRVGGVLSGTNPGSRFMFPGNVDLPPNPATNLIESELIAGIGGRAGDKRHLLNVGPVDVAAGDTLEFVCAVTVARGINNLNSVAVLKRYAQALKGMLATGVPEIPRPKSFSLSQNYPNPFNPETVITYELPMANDVSLKVFDVLGREVATVVNERKPSGNYSVRFNAARLASGVYFYRLKAGDFISTRKMIFLK